eukprot:7964924-Prorocentrum_lima.AAC.1
MGFGDAPLVLDTCQQRMQDWLTQLKEAVAAGLDKQTACQLLGWVGSSLAVYTVRTLSLIHISEPTRLDVI